MAEGLGGDGEGEDVLCFMSGHWESGDGRFVVVGLVSSGRDLSHGTCLV